MEAWLEGVEPTNEQLVELIRVGTLMRAFVPVMCGSAFKNKGVQVSPQGSGFRVQGIWDTLGEERFVGVQNRHPCPPLPLIFLPHTLLRTLQPLATCHQGLPPVAETWALGHILSLCLPGSPFWMRWCPTCLPPWTCRP